MTDAVQASTLVVTPNRKATRNSALLGQLPLYLWLAILVVLPNLLLIAVSFFRSSGGGVVYEANLANYGRALASSSIWILLGRTLTTAAGSAMIGSLIAYPMAYYATRVLRRGKVAAVLLVIIPLWISLLMRVFAWRLILGERGVLNSCLVWSGILSHPSEAFLYSRFAVLLTFVYVSIPFIFVSVHSAIERIPYNLIEAANDCGASGMRAFRTVLWPLSKPGLAIGASLAFLMAVGDYVTPSMVGGLDGTMLGVVIASQFGIAGNWPYGASLAVILLAAVATLLLVVFRLARVPGILVGEGASPSAGGGRRTLVQRLGSALGFLAFCLPYLFLYAPLVIIALLSFNTAERQALPMSGWTLRWYEELASNGALLAALTRSLVVGMLVLLIAVVGGTGFAILFALGRVRASKWAENLLLLPVAVPGVVLGITLVLTFQLLSVPIGIPRIVLGHATFVMPVVMMIVLSRLRRLDPALVEASTDLGATPLQTFWFVLLPLVRGAVIGGALLGFTLSVDEVVVSVFLTGTQPTLPVWVWNQMRFGFTPSVNAIFVCIGVTTVGLILLSRKLITLSAPAAP